MNVICLLHFKLSHKFPIIELKSQKVHGKTCNSNIKETSSSEFDVCFIQILGEGTDRFIEKLGHAKQ